MHLQVRKIAPLVACTAAASAAFAHYAIDVIGDFALAHDRYDDLDHVSRGIVAAVATLIALCLAARGVRVCLELAAHRNGRISAGLSRCEATALVLASAVCSIALVPLMEWGDGRVAGLPVDDLTSAFGGSIAIGVLTTLFSAVLLTFSVACFVQWLCRRRTSIAAIVAALLGRRERFPECSSNRQRPHRRRIRRRCAGYAVAVFQRGPPNDACHSIILFLLKGDPCETQVFARRAYGCRGGAVVRLCGA